MQLTERELQELATEVDDLHHESMRTFKEETADLHVDSVRARRRFLAGSAGVAAVGAAVLLPGLPARLAAARGLRLDDASIAGYAQSVELAAVAVYTMAAPLLTPATLPVAQLFLSHHTDHAAAFGAVAGSHAATAPNAKLVAALGPSIAALKTEKDALEFAFVVEGQAAYTYAAALTLLQDPKYAAATATILPIEAQHQVVLGLALGKSVKDVFPTGAFESAALGDGSDPLKGLDPATFG
jgi:hypothetical protein